jgi:hypothetical protein
VRQNVEPPSKALMEHDKSNSWALGSDSGDGHFCYNDCSPCAPEQEALEFHISSLVYF